jgi:glycosyltransferase involved in cell wall biosynthesis
MVHDCAYVGYELSKELKNRGYNVKNLYFSKIPKLSTLEMILRLRRERCDLIHAHYLRSPAYASYLSGKPYIVHCHGSDVRYGLNYMQRRCLDKAKMVLVSTPDLLDVLPNAFWLPNPVDLNKFKRLKTHFGNKILYFSHWYEDLSEILRDICKKLRYNLTIKRMNTIPYEEMPNFLNEFDIFVDRFSISSYSKTALEAMACGLAVVSYNCDLKSSLERLRDLDVREKWIEKQYEVVKEHDVENVVNKLVKIYEQVINP